DVDAGAHDAGGAARRAGRRRGRRPGVARGRRPAVAAHPRAGARPRRLDRAAAGVTGVAARRPTVVLAHWPEWRLFSRRDLEALSAVAEVLDPEPLGAWDDPRAGALLAEAEVVLGHWGCPPLDAAVLDRAPRLGLLAYAAGTVKGVVDD